MGVHHRTPLNGVLFLTSQVTLLVLSIPAFIPKPAQVITFILLGWYFYRVIFTQTTGDFNNDFGLGSAIIVQYMLAVDYALITPPQNLRNLHDEDRTRVTERRLKERALWAFGLYSNPRGIGWAHEPSHLPSRPSHSTPRSTFVVSRILLALCCFLIVGGSSYLVDATYAGITTADKLLTGAPFHQRVLGVLAFGSGGIFMMLGLNALLSSAIIGCGFSSPDRWPVLFGSPFEVWSIKRFWGRFWHHMIRRCILTYTTSILGCVFPAIYVGTTGYQLARLYTAFCISGLVHACGDVMASGQLGFKSFTFFMLQPFGITIELVVSYLWCRLQNHKNVPKRPTADDGADSNERASGKHHISMSNSKSFAQDSMAPLWIRCVGSIWLGLWMLWTAPYIVDALFFARLSASSDGFRV